MMKELIGRVDEILGACMLTCIAVYSMVVGIPEIAQACVTGIVALLAVSAAKK